MNYTRKANPNATNSELDAKKIIIHNPPQSVTVDLTFDEKYQMVKLYETLLDMDLIDDCPIEVETAFDKIMEAK